MTEKSKRATITVDVTGLEQVRSLVSALRDVLDERERELLELKGPCWVGRCRLHYAHSGPCDIKEPRP